MPVHGCAELSRARRGLGRVSASLALRDGKEAAVSCQLSPPSVTMRIDPTRSQSGLQQRADDEGRP
jgi:hypothetical protein